MGQPIQYLSPAEIRSPIESVMAGYEQGLKNRKLRQKEEEAKQMQSDLATLARNPNPTGEDFAQIMTKYPQLSDEFKKTWDVLDETQRQNQINELSGIYASLQSGDTETAINLLKQRKKAAENAGMDKEATEAEIMIKQIEINPAAARTSTQLALSAAMGPNKFAETLSKIQGKTAVQHKVLDDKQKKALGLDPEKPYQINTSTKKITSVGGGGVSVNIGPDGKIGKIPSGWVVKEDEQGNYFMEMIKGGPIEKKAKAIAKAQKGQKELEKRAGNVVIEDIKRLQTKIENSPWWSPVIGVRGKLISKFQIPGSNRIDAEQLKTTIEANIGFDRLQQMREASPTGGALGQVSERELTTLQSVLGSLSLSQSEEQLMKNLDRLNKIYKEILRKAAAYPNAAEFGFGGVPSELNKDDRPEGTSGYTEEVEAALSKYPPKTGGE